MFNVMFWFKSIFRNFFQKSTPSRFLERTKIAVKLVKLVALTKVRFCFDKLMIMFTKNGLFHINMSLVFNILKTSCKDVFKTSWKTKNCYAEEVFKTS